MATKQQFIATRGFAVSIRSSRWKGREPDPLPVYGSFITKNTRGSEAQGYVIAWDGCGFELVISDTTGGPPSIAYVIIDGAEVFRTYFPGTKHSVVIKGFYDTRSRVLPFIFRKRHSEEQTKFSAGKTFGEISVVFREPLPQSLYYHRKNIVGFSLHRSTDFKVSVLHPACYVNAPDPRTIRSGRFDVEPLATITLRYTAGYTLFRDILPLQQVNDRKGNKRELDDASSHPSNKRQRVKDEDVSTVSLAPSKPSVSAKLLTERSLYPPEKALTHESLELKRVAILMKLPSWLNPAFEASPLRNEVKYHRMY
ncbi:hypothetical protein PENSPDRAFT_681005 [Peniophora sp. CONT]|nr:hypothetical protein PENSPDRAFT_681005 [Peniophora sp. CONT]